MTQKTAVTRFNRAIAGALAVAVLAATAALPSHAAQTGSLDATTKSGVKVGRALINNTGDLIILWGGQIMPGMANFVDRAFAKYGRDANGVRLLIDSTGGNVREGEQVIRILRRIKRTHRLETRVVWGGKCHSMCVPIFLQGKDRVAARSSVWVFHDVARKTASGHQQFDREETVRLYRRYFVEAGVSVAWLNSVLQQIRNADLWQTGQELIAAKSGIITHVLGNRTARR